MDLLGLKQKMNKEEQNLNNVENPKLSISDVMCSGHAVRFNEADSNGIIINKDAINIKDFEQMKVAGTIVDYEIDDNGVKIIKKFVLRSVSL
jgi:hypothetical protein